VAEVDPPRVEKEVGSQADHHDERQPYAIDALHGVGAHRAAAEPDGERDLAARQNGPNGDGEQGDTQPNEAR